MTAPDAPTLHGEIESPRPLRAVDGKITLTGWCLIPGLPDAPPVRVVADAGTLPMSARRERPDLVLLLPGEPAAGHCGFVIEGTLPAGLHHARFEAQTPDAAWQVFKRLTLAAEPVPFAAALDEPIRSGTLRDRVKVGGWALDATSPIVALTLRYGHREIACTLNQPRPDVAAAYPAIAHTARAGFVSEDFLVAGHGPVRIRARLADGRTVVAPSNVSFSIATDENHGPENQAPAGEKNSPVDRAQRAGRFDFAVKRRCGSCGHGRVVPDFPPSARSQAVHRQLRDVLMAASSTFNFRRSATSCRTVALPAASLASDCARAALVASKSRLVCTCC